MTAPNTNQFDSICPVCNKKITPGHTHEGQSPEEAAALAGNANATNFCFHCGEPGSYEQHEEEGFHTCEACGEPGTSAEHEITGHHTGGTCPRCKLSLTPTHNCLKFSGVTAQKKGGKAAAVAQANAVLGREVPRYEIIEDPDTGLETKTLMNPEAFPTGATEASRKLTSDPRYMGINPDTKEVMYAFDNSGATTASQHAATRGASLSQPHRDRHYTALVMFHPGVQRPGRAQGMLKVSPSDIVPHTNVVESERDVYESVQKTKVDKAGRTIKVTRKTKNGVKVPVMTYVQKLDKNGQPVKEKYTETHKGVMINGSFYKDSEIKNLSYSLNDPASGLKQQTNEAGETSLVPKSEEELNAEHLAQHETYTWSRAVRTRLDRIRNANEAALRQRNEQRAQERTTSYFRAQRDARRAAEAEVAKMPAEHAAGKHNPQELAAAWIEAASRIGNGGPWFNAETFSSRILGHRPGTRSPLVQHPLKIRDLDLRYDPSGLIAHSILEQAAPKVSTHTRQVFQQGKQVGTTATPYIGAADPETGEQQQGVDVRPVHRAVPAGTETYQVTEPRSQQSISDAYRKEEDIVTDALFGRFQKALDANPQVSFLPHVTKFLNIDEPFWQNGGVDLHGSACKACAKEFADLVGWHMKKRAEMKNAQSAPQNEGVAPKKAAKKAAPKKAAKKAAPKKGKKS